MQVDGSELCQRGPRHRAHLRRRPEHERGARARSCPNEQSGTVIIRQYMTRDKVKIRIDNRSVG